MISNSYHMAMRLEQLGVNPTKTRIIPNPVNLHEIITLASRPCSIQDFDNQELPLFVSIGRLTVQKGMDRLIDWIGQMEEDANLLIIGDGDELLTISGMIDERGLYGKVKIMNFQKNPFPFMAKADAVLLGSRWEGLPNVALEALALGKVVIAARECESLRHLKNTQNIPELTVPETGEAFVRELDNIARNIISGGVKFQPPFASALPDEFYVQKVVSRYCELIFGD